MLLNIINLTHDVSTKDQTIPLFFFNSSWDKLWSNLYWTDASYDMYALEDLINLGTLNISTLLNSILTGFVFIGDDLLNFLAAMLIVFIFGNMYSKSSSDTLLQKITWGVKKLWLINIIYFVIYLTIQALLFVLPWYYQTKHWLNPNIRNFFVDNDQVKYNFVIGFMFLVVLFVIHLFIDSLTTSKHISPEVPVLTYLVACFGWSLLELNDFALFIVCLEGFSLTLYILATVGRTYGGVSASIKYFVFGTLGSVLFYWGGLNIFDLLATMRLDLISELTEVSISSEINYATYSKLVWAQTFILIGFLIKLGAAPTHQWISDVYAGVPMFVTAFYSTFVKLVLFVLFLKFATVFISTKEIEYAALLSLIIGCFGALRQTEIKRFLAYGSITHTGYLLMGDLTATYVYLTTYILASLVFFSVLLSLRLNGQELIYLSDLRFVGQSISQLDRGILIVALASMAGLPPFAGFYGKMSVWMSLMEDVYLFNDFWSFILLFANILTSLIVMFYYAQIMCILFVNDELTNTNSVFFQKSKITNLKFDKNKMLKTFQILGLLLLTLWTFVMPVFLTLMQNTL